MSACTSTFVHLQSGEDSERGREARKRVQRSSHSEWAPAPDRPDSVETLRAQAETRVQELVPIRYGRMLVSAFTPRTPEEILAAPTTDLPDASAEAGGVRTGRQPTQQNGR